MTRFGTGAAERLKQSEHEFEKNMVVSSKNGELLSLRNDGHDDSFSLHMNTRGDANDRRRGRCNSVTALHIMERLCTDLCASMLRCAGLPVS